VGGRLDTRVLRWSALRRHGRLDSPAYALVLDPTFPGVGAGVDLWRDAMEALAEDMLKGCRGRQSIQPCLRAWGKVEYTCISLKETLSRISEAFGPARYKRMPAYKIVVWRVDTSSARV
jgi:hypothetical protein